MGRAREPAYPLEAALRQRRIERDARAGEVRDAQADEEERARALRSAEERLLAARREFEEAEQARAQRTREGGRACELQSWIARDSALADAVSEASSDREAAAARHQASRLALEKARDGLAAAMARLGAVEKHREAWLEEARRNAEKKAEEDP
jgi:hypothetical protein